MGSSEIACAIKNMSIIDGTIWLMSLVIGTYGLYAYSSQLVSIGFGMFIFISLAIYGRYQMTPDDFDGFSA